MACLTKDKFIEQVTEKFELSEEEVQKAAAVYDTFKVIQSRYVEGLEDDVSLGVPYKANTVSDVDSLLEMYSEEFPNGLPVRYNGSKDVKYVQFKNVQELDNYVTFTLSNNAEYTFNKGQDRSVDTKKGTHIVVDGLGKITHTLGSKKKQVNWDNLAEDKNYDHLSKTSMKSTLDKLIKMDKTDAVDAEYYKDLLDKLDGSFTRKLKLFVKKTTQESYGEISGKSIKIAVSNRAAVAANQQSAAEVYMHELWHALTSFGLRDTSPEARKLVRELEYVRSVAKDKLTWKAFLPEVSIDTALEEAKAKEQYNYVFNSENTLDEFMAYAITNPQLRKVLGKVKLGQPKTAHTVLEKIVNLLDTLVNVVLGNYKFKERNQTIYDHVFNLSMELSAVNDHANDKITGMKSMLNAGHELVDKIDRKVANKLNELKDKYLTDDEPLADYPYTGSRTAKAAWTLKLLKKAAINEQYGKALGLIMSSYGIAPDGIIRNVLKDMKEPSDWEKAAEFLQLESDKIEGERNSKISATKRVVADGFTRKLSMEEERALLRVIVDLDMQSLPAKDRADTNQDRYSTAKLRELLEDKAALEKAIGNAKYRLEQADPKYANWHKTQAHGLGYYLATHKAGIAQNLNAVNIARGLISNHYKTPDKKVIKLVDEVATLVGLLYADPKDKLVVAKLLKEERAGVFNLMAVHRGYNKEAYKTLFSDNSSQMVKGYSKEVFDDTIVSEVAPISTRKDMEDAGYEYVGPVEGKYGDSNEEPMGLFISGSYGRSDYLRAMTRLTRTGVKGTTVTESKHKDGGEFAKERAQRDIAKLDIERLKVVNSMLKGTYDPEKAEMGLVPVLDSTGLVVNYRYMMGKDQKEKLLKQDTSVLEVMGRTYGSMFDRLASKKHNSKVLGFILKNMEDNWNGGLLGKDGLTEYTIISAKSRDPKIKELYEILPKDFKAAANSRADKSLAVPTSMMPLFFGYRHLMLADAAIVKMMPKIIREALRVVETMWVELVKIAKTNILLKIPTVFLSNLFSNIAYVVNTGTPIHEVFQQYLESFRDVRAHIKKHRELVALEVKVTAKTATRAEMDKIKVLKADLARNPVHELMEAGMYQAFQEDVENIDLRSSNKWKKIVDDKMQMVPSFIKTPLQWLYLSEETKFYKVSQEMLQMSDLIGRDLMNRRLKKEEQLQADGKKELPRWWIEKQKDENYKTTQELKGDERKQFLKEVRQNNLYAVLQAFINYNKPSSSLEEWLNRVGVLRFTKFAKRIQLVTAKTTLDHPVRSLLTGLAQKFVYDFESIQDQTAFAKQWYTRGFGPGNIVPIYSPLSTIEQVVEPPLIAMLGK